MGLIKHSHHAFEIDYPGKDSYELRKAGCRQIMLSSSHRRAIIMDHRELREPALNHELAHFDQTGLDLVLVEGFRAEPFPKIELYRRALGKALLYPDDDMIIAIATDSPLSPIPKIPRLDLNNPGQVADFILDEFLPRQC